MQEELGSVREQSGGGRLTTFRAGEQGRVDACAGRQSVQRLKASVASLGLTSLTDFRMTSRPGRVQHTQLRGRQSWKQVVIAEKQIV